MLEIFEYAFFRNALLGILIISVASAMIGTYIVSRRLVAISGGITHACFGGLGMGYYLGISPVLMASIFAVGASAGVEWMSSRYRIREDSAIAVVWALGMAIGILFVFLTPGYVPELNTFLFGNVLTISHTDLLTFAIYTAVLLTFFLLFYRKIVGCAFDPDFARVTGVNVRFINYSMTVLVAVCIVLTIRMAGIMLLMSMFTLPQMMAELRYRRFRQIMIASACISAVCCVGGLLLSAVIDVPCSALIVMLMVVCYMIGRFSRALRLAIIGGALLLTGATSCSMKKNTAVTRQYTAFITRYNVYFNGDEHYRETLKVMEDTYEDDYSDILYLHPTEARENQSAPQPNGDFKRSIEKAQKAIQIRSIKKRPQRKNNKGNDPEYKKWLKREEYNPFLHNAWMMMARSQYMNGDFFGAASTFYYVSRHFWWLPATVTEARLWQARCYCAVDWLFEAQTILESIPDTELTNSTLEGLYYFTWADYYVKSADYEKAAPALVKAISYAKGAQKTRLTFLLGQVYQKLDRRAEAYAEFSKVAGKSSASYRTRLSARIRQSEVYTGSDVSKEVRSLEALARQPRNMEYRDQIYYAIGNLYMNQADTIKALEAYEKAVSQESAQGIDQALAHLKLGELYYEDGKYDKAQPHYSAAVPRLTDRHPDYTALKLRSDVLDELAIYSQNVTLQDSLLKLSYLTPEEQRAVADRLIDELNKKEKEEAEAAAREEYLAQQAAAGTGLQQGSAAAASTFTLNTDKSWYFYNRATREAGRVEFQKRWGSRRLEDNWRRRNKSSIDLSPAEEDYASEDGSVATDSIAGDGSDMASADDRENTSHRHDPHYPEYYLSQIPKDDTERTIARDVIQEGLYNMAVILKDKMNDYPAAERTFDRLLTEYPDNVYRLDAYYNLFLMYSRMDNEAMAQKYRNLILSDFSDSKYGEAMADPDYFDKLRRMLEIQESLYAKAYDAYMSNDNAEVHSIYERMRKEYPMSRIMPKFMFLEALSYVTVGDSKQFSATLKDLVDRYPDADVTALASAWLKQVRQGRDINSSGSNLRGMSWRLRAQNDSTMTDPDAPAQFDFDPAKPQLFVLIYPVKDVSPNELLFDVARFNFASFVVRDFDLEQMQFGDMGVLVVKGFDNEGEVRHYRSLFEAPGAVNLPRSVIPVIISQANFDMMLSQGRSFDEYFQATGDHRLEEVHNSVLDPEEYPAADEMYPKTQADFEDLPQEGETEIESTPAGSPDTELLPSPALAPSAQPTTKPKAKPAAKSEPKAAAKPASKAAPKTPAKPAPPAAPVPIPEYPSGSEGDDPLLDD